MELTNIEELAVTKLEEIARTWPRSLWLFSASGQLCVMKKKGQWRDVVFKQDNPPVYNSKKMVAVIDIENDGGDW